MKHLKISCAALLAALSLVACSSDNNNEDIDINPPAQSNPQVSNPTSQVIYEANPLFFANDKCFDAINGRLDAIHSMGTDVLWIMPIFTQGQKNAIGSPYCVKDYKGINPKYGDMQALKSLVDAAHAKGMIVILDWIANHTAWDNAWITEHPDWFLHDNKGNIVSPPGQNWADVAQLDYKNAAMRAAMIDAMTYWIKQAGVDGFRCDYAEGVPADFWAEAITAIRKVKGNAFMLAEASKFDLYNVGFDMIYDWSFCTDLQGLFNGKINTSKFVENIQKRDASIPQGKNIMRYALNHDVLAENSPKNMYGSDQAIPAAYVVAAFSGQVPLIYSGMEAGFDDRTGFIGAKPLTWNADILAKYKEIAKAYDATKEARAGTMRAYDSGTKCIVFSLSNGDKQVLVMVNPSGQQLQAKVPLAFIGVGMTECITNQQSLMPSVISVPAYGYSIFMR